MYKFVVLFALIAVACAAPKPGYLAAPALYHSAPVVHSVPVATSYAHTYKAAYKSPLVYTAQAAPVAVHHQPIAYSSHPVPLTYAAHASPLAYYH